MIQFVALSFTAFCRELAYCRKTPADITHGFFVFNCHRDHIFGTPDMTANFGEDKPCSELIDMMRRYMKLSEVESLEFVMQVQGMLFQAEAESRMYCMNGLQVVSPQTTKKLLVFGGLVQAGRLPSQVHHDWLESDGNLATWLEGAGIPVIR